jgi:hypothetical protein
MIYVYSFLNAKMSIQITNNSATAISVYPQPVNLYSFNKKPATEYEAITYH